MKLLVTGGTGFIGKEFCKSAENNSIEVCRVTRETPKNDTDKAYWVTSSIDSVTDWTGAFDDIECIVHCAARVHQINESEEAILEAYREVNTRGTLNLARQAAQAGVKRFVFISSIKVNGEFSPVGKPFTSELNNAPKDPYGKSKYEAEMQLKKLAKETGLEVVIIRPPLVYGPGVKANFLTLMRWVEKGVPLPLGSMHNLRSFVYVGNLVDLMLTCCSHPNASGETFLVSDDNDLSTTGLIKALSKEMGKKVILIPIPMVMMRVLTNLIGKPEIGQRLCLSLQADTSKTKTILRWTPPISFESALRKTVEAYYRAL